MKSFLALLLITHFASAPVYAASDYYYKDVTKTAAPSSDMSAIGSDKPNAQEIIDVTRTGQAAPVRTWEKEEPCRGANGSWLYKGDAGYLTCTRGE